MSLQKGALKTLMKDALPGAPELMCSCQQSRYYSYALTKCFLKCFLKHFLMCSLMHFPQVPDETPSYLMTEIGLRF